MLEAVTVHKVSCLRRQCTEKKRNNLNRKSHWIKKMINRSIKKGEVEGKKISATPMSVGLY